jgi:hypothetical protein
MTGHPGLMARLVTKASESTAKELTKAVGGMLLHRVMATAIAEPAAAILGEVAGAFASALLEQTSAIERKLDKLLAEPFETAVTTIEEAVLARPSTPVEFDERNRQLQRAFDDLRKARTLAEDEEERNVVRLYQVLVAAMMRGGGAYVREYVAELRSLAQAAREQATFAKANASALHPEEQYEALQNLAITEGQMMLPSGLGGTIGMANQVARLEKSKQQWLDEATQMAGYAGYLDLFCDFVSALSLAQRP